MLTEALAKYQWSRGIANLPSTYHGNFPMHLHLSFPARSILNEVISDDLLPYQFIQQCSFTLPRWVSSTNFLEVLMLFPDSCKKLTKAFLPRVWNPTTTFSAPPSYRVGPVSRRKPIESAVFGRQKLNLSSYGCDHVLGCRRPFGNFVLNERGPDHTSKGLTPQSRSNSSSR